VPSDSAMAHLLAATEHLLLVEQDASPVPFAPAGWRNVLGQGTITTLSLKGEHKSIAMRRLADGTRQWILDGEMVDALVSAEVDGVTHVSVNGLRRAVHVAAHGASLLCDDGLWSSHIEVVPRFTDNDHDGAAAGPETPVPGTITAVLVAAGDRVEVGDTLVVLEAMKMEHRIKSDVAGTVASVHVAVGENVDAHHLVVEVTADESEGEAAE